MSTNLKQMHQDIDKFYSRGYLDAWCSYVHTEWQEFLDRAFSILIPQIFDELLEANAKSNSSDEGELIDRRFVVIFRSTLLLTLFDLLFLYDPRRE